MKAYTLEDFGPFTLSASSHDSPSDGMCVMEMVSFLAGDDWSDNPPCSSPVVSRFCQVINDRMGQGVRDKLQAYVPRLIGTVSPLHENERAEYLAWTSIRVFTPIAFRASGLDEWADRLERLDGSLSDAMGICRKAMTAAAAASASASAAASADAAYAAAAASASTDAADAAYAASAAASSAYAAAASASAYAASAAAAAASAYAASTADAAAASAAVVAAYAASTSTATAASAAAAFVETYAETYDKFADKLLELLKDCGETK